MRPQSRRQCSAAGLAALSLVAVVAFLVLLQQPVQAAAECIVNFPNICGCEDEACARCDGCKEEQKVHVKKDKAGKLSIIDGPKEVPKRHLLAEGTGSDTLLLSGDATTELVQRVKASAAAGRQLHQFGSELVCDGRINYLQLPRPPWPTGAPFTPYNSPSGLQCSRSSGQCGNLGSVTCLPFSSNIGPVSLGDGLQISPENPLRFTVTTNKFLTFLNWTVFDVGTGGAKMKANYASNPNTGSPTIQPEQTTYSWEPPPENPGDQCGSCTGCVIGQGIQVMSLAADAGAGFSSFELSQLFTTRGCGKSCVDLDASYWVGMTYSCAEPTCGDTRLDQAGDQPYDCSTVGLGWTFNQANADSTDVGPSTCCIRNPTCGNTNPGSFPAQTYQCNLATSEYNPMSADLSPPSQQLCCKDMTCGDVKPVTAPNTPYTCPSPGYVYNPMMSGLKPPSTSLCCTPQPSCGNTVPGSVTPIPFNCDRTISEYNPATFNVIPATQSNCCTNKTCGNISPITEPGRQWTCSLPSSSFNTSAWMMTPPSDQNCCIQKTCGNSQPGSSTPIPYDCGAQYQYDPSKSSLPASQTNCCLLRTCSNFVPVTTPPFIDYPCPDGLIFVPSNQPASQANCCTGQTCANNAQGWSCSIVGESCANKTNYASTPLAPGSNIGIFQDTCCNCSTKAQSSASISIVKTASTRGPVVAGAGTQIIFTLTIAVSSLDLPSSSLSNVTVTDYVPAGFKILNVVTTPSLGRVDPCKADPLKNLINCTFGTGLNGQPPPLPVFEETFVKVTVVPILAGSYTNCARLDWTPQAGVTDNTTPTQKTSCAPAVTILGSCCIKELINGQMMARCEQRVEANCELRLSPTYNQTFIANLPCKSVDCVPVNVNEGACCVPKDISTCVDRVQQAGCIKAGGIWYAKKLCSDVPCNDPKGACCNVVDGTCYDSRTLLNCPLSQALWKKGGSCGDPRYCVGACCRNPGTSFALCQENTKAFNCQGPNQFWHIYGQCHAATCPSDQKCIPCWWKCDPRNDQCCPTCSCQYTWKACQAGEWVCKPKKTCADQGEPCGGDSGGCCCDGFECHWDYKYRRGVCAPKRPKCVDNGGYCRGDGECCPGYRCYGGRSRMITYRMCYRPCFGYSCYLERKKDFDCFYANVAGRWKY